MIRPRRTVDDSTPTATLMTRLRRTVDDPTPTAWLGVVTVSNMVSVEGYTQAHPTEDFDPPTVEVIPAMRDGSQGERFDVRLLNPGDTFYCHDTHMRLVLEQLGEATFRLDPGDPWSGLAAEFREPIVLIGWHQLGLIFPNPDKPPPVRFRLVKLRDHHEFEIEHTLYCSLLRLCSTQAQARQWSQRRAKELLAKYTHNRDRMRSSQTA